MSRRDFSHANNPAFACAPDVVLLPFGRLSYLPALVERFAGEAVVLDETTDRLAYQLRGAESPVTLVYSGMGSPAAANALEMIAANGGRRVVVFGACGGTDPKVAVGDLIVVSGAVRGEGTSRYYAPLEYPAAFHPVLTARLLEAATAGGAAAHLGVVYTTDAGYRQGPEIYEECAGLVVGVESECAAVAVVSARLGLRAGALLVVTDNVSAPEGPARVFRGLDEPVVARGFERAVAGALDALAGLEL